MLQTRGTGFPITPVAAGSAAVTTQMQPLPKCSHTHVPDSFCTQQRQYTEAPVFTGFPTSSPQASRTLAIRELDQATDLGHPPPKNGNLSSNLGTSLKGQNNLVLIRIICILLLSSKQGEGSAAPRQQFHTLDPAS